jgi:hypothetical protein
MKSNRFYHYSVSPEKAKVAAISRNGSFLNWSSVPNHSEPGNIHHQHHGQLTFFLKNFDKGSL